MIRSGEKIRKLRFRDAKTQETHTWEPGVTTQAV